MPNVSYCFETLRDLRLAPLSETDGTVVTTIVNSVVTTKGYWTAGDGGGSSYYWDPASPLPENGGTVIKRLVEAPGTPSVGQYQLDTAEEGRWIMIHNGTTSAKQWGARGFWPETTESPEAQWRKSIQRALYDVFLTAAENVWLTDSLATTTHVPTVGETLAMARSLFTLTGTTTAGVFQAYYGSNFEYLNFADETVLPTAKSKAITWTSGGTADYLETADFVFLQNAIDWCMRLGIKLQVPRGNYELSRSLKIGEADYYARCDAVKKLPISRDSTEGVLLRILSEGFVLEGVTAAGTGIDDGVQLKLIRDRINRHLFYYFGGTQTSASLPFTLDCLLHGPLHNSLYQGQDSGGDIVPFEHHIPIPEDGAPASISGSAFQTAMQDLGAAARATSTSDASLSSVRRSWEIQLPYQLSIYHDRADPYYWRYHNYSECHGEVNAVMSGDHAATEYALMLADSGVICYYPTAGNGQKIRHLCLSGQNTGFLHGASYGLCYASSVMTSSHASDLTTRYCHTGLAILNGGGFNGEFTQFERVICSASLKNNRNPDGTPGTADGNEYGMDRGFVCFNGQSFNIQFIQCQFYIASYGAAFETGEGGGKGYGLSVIGCNITFDNERLLAQYDHRSEVFPRLNPPSTASSFFTWPYEEFPNWPYLPPTQSNGQYRFYSRRSSLLRVGTVYSTFEFVGGRVEHMDTLVYYSGDASNDFCSPITFRGVEFAGCQTSHIHAFVDRAACLVMKLDGNPNARASHRITLDDCALYSDTFDSQELENAKGILTFRGFKNDMVQTDIRGGVCSFGRVWYDNAAVRFQDVTMHGVRVNTTSTDYHDRFHYLPPCFRTSHSTDKGTALGLWSPSFDDPSANSFGPPENLLPYQDMSKVDYSSATNPTLRSWRTSYQNPKYYVFGNQVIAWNSPDRYSSHAMGGYGGTLVMEAGGTVEQSIPCIEKITSSTLEGYPLADYDLNPAGGLLYDSYGFDCTFQYEGLFLLSPPMNQQVNKIIDPSIDTSVWRGDINLRIDILASFPAGYMTTTASEVLLQRWEQIIPAADLQRIRNYKDKEYVFKRPDGEWDGSRMVRIVLPFATSFSSMVVNGSYTLPSKLTVRITNLDTMRLGLGVLRQSLQSGRGPKCFANTSTGSAVYSRNLPPLHRRWLDSVAFGSEIVLPERPVTSSDRCLVGMEPSLLENQLYFDRLSGKMHLHKGAPYMEGGMDIGRRFLEPVDGVVKLASDSTATAALVRGAQRNTTVKITHSSRQISGEDVPTWEDGAEFIVVRTDNAGSMGYTVNVIHCKTDGSSASTLNYVVPANTMVRFIWRKNSNTTGVWVTQATSIQQTPLP